MVQSSSLGKSRRSRRVAVLGAAGTIASAAVVLSPHGAHASQGPGCTTDEAGVTQARGTIANGAPYLMAKPGDWNGTLLVYSRGGPVVTPPADAPSAPGLRSWLLDRGYALLGSSYSAPGWAVEEAPADQVATIEVFRERFGDPGRTIAWGRSLGGAVTGAIIERHPDRFDGAIPMCSGLGGTVGQWNQLLDATFVIRTLLAPDSGLELVDLPPHPRPTPGADLAHSVVDEAQSTPEGRARIALAAVMNTVPLWVDPDDPEPASDDDAAQQVQLYKGLKNAIRLGLSAPRQELEHRAGGNFSWNTGVDYRRQLASSGRMRLVAALYREAGLSLRSDLRALAEEPRIAAAPEAVAYAARNILPTGAMSFPVLTLNNTGDPSATPAHEDSYRRVVSSAGNRRLLRQSFVHSAGHCAFTAAETAAALLTLERRLDTGTWGSGVRPEAMNAAAEATGLPGPSRYLSYRPDRFLRPFPYHPQ